MTRPRELALVIVVALAAPAGAQTPNREGAKLFEEGRALAKAGKHEQACAKFAKSLALDPAIGTQLNYADCHEKLGQYVDAWRIFDSAADAEKITNPERAKFARGRADALLPKVGIVVIEVQTPISPQLAITIGGRAVKAAAVIREIVEPGPVEISARAASGDPFQATETVAAGKTVKVSIPAFADRGGSMAESPAGEPRAVRRPSRVYLAYGVGGMGVLSLATGIVVGLAAKGNYDAQFDSGNCQRIEPNSVCNAEGFAAQNSARSLGTIGTVLGVGGLAMIAGGAVLFLTAPRDLVIIPTMTAQSAGLAVVGNF